MIDEYMDIVPDKVKVSAIIPLYNVADLIETTITSLLKQTLQEIEFILVDDGSTDGSYEVALRFAKDNPKLRVVRQENAGPAAARNHGLRLAQGEFICFIDSDDFMDNNALDLMYRAALKHDADLVMGGTVRFNSKRVWEIPSYVRYGVLNPGEKTIYRNPELLYAMGPCAKLYRRKIIENTYFPEHIRLGEDQPFALHAYLNAKKIYTVDSTVYYYRYREGENKSLTQRAMQNPDEVFHDLFEMIRITNGQFAGHHRLHTLYLERFMMSDLRPRFRAALSSRKDAAQKKVLQIMYNWIQGSDKTLLNDVQVIYSYTMIELLYWYRILTSQNRPLALQLMRLCLNRMTWRDYPFFIISAFREGYRHTKRFVKRRFWHTKKSFKGTVKSVLLKQMIFPLAKRFLRFESKKMVLATNRSSELEGNLEVIRKEMSRHPEWSVETYAKKDRTFAEMVRLYRSLATAKVVVLDDYYSPLYGLRCRKNTEVIQTWHASGAFKKFGLSSVGAEDSNPRPFEEAAHMGYTKVLTTSKSIVPHYMEAFQKSLDQVLPIGLPKNDVFFNAEFLKKNRDNYLKEFPALQNKKILLYAPTFRGSPKERVKFDLKLNLMEMRKQLGHSYFVILKLHPMVKQMKHLDARLSDFVLDLSCSHEINNLLMLADVLISDYSSVVFEYSLLKRPMIFFAYDLEHYLKERGFYYDYRSFVPGPIVKNTEEVIQHILRPQFPLEKADEFSRYFFDDQDGGATKRFTETFLKD